MRPFKPTWDIKTHRAWAEVCHPGQNIHSNCACKGDSKTNASGKVLRINANSPYDEKNIFQKQNN